MLYDCLIGCCLTPTISAISWREQIIYTRQLQDPKK